MATRGIRHAVTACRLAHVRCHARHFSSQASMQEALKTAFDAEYSAAGDIQVGCTCQQSFL
jgi:hypothetical protein